MIRYVLQGLCGLMIAAATLAVPTEARRPAAAGFNASISPASSSASYQASAQFGGGRSGGATTWDFETGNLSGCQATGTAFTTQPTYGDNTSARKEPPANSQGLFWIGMFENYLGPGRGVAGGIQGDGPQARWHQRRSSFPPRCRFVSVAELSGHACRARVDRSD